MPTTEYSIWDYAVSYGGPSLFMTAVFVVVLPLVYLKFARPRFQRWPPRLAVLLGVWLVAWCVAYGDVLWIAREAKRLCETEAGLRVYGTAEAEGFAGLSSIEDWAKFGFSFVERIHSSGGSTVYRLVDGVPSSTESSVARSKYAYGLRYSEESRYVSMKIETVSRVESDEVIGELVTFIPHLGWLDSAIAGNLGASYSPKMCDGRGLMSPENKTLSFKDLIRSTLRAPSD